MRRTLPATIFLASALCARDRIASIDFFGCEGVDVAAVRKALPFREGDKGGVSRERQARAAVRRVTGRDATNVSGICCVGDGDFAVFIGLPGASSRPLSYHPAPLGDVAAPRELESLYRKMQEAEFAAIRQGRGEEDGSPGYRLSRESRARAAQLALRDYALGHEDELVRLLELSRHSGRRAMAADALGYAARSSRQLAALVHAALDPDPEVRNNSTRALSEILRAEPSLAPQISPEPFIAMVRSGAWTDRNKASLVLWPLTQSRDPQLLARLKSEAGAALLEMARWTANWSSFMNSRQA